MYIYYYVNKINFKAMSSFLVHISLYVDDMSKSINLSQESYVSLFISIFQYLFYFIYIYFKSKLSKDNIEKMGLNDQCKQK